MHVFLTSSPCSNDVPVGVDLPCIFDERNSFVENLRERVPENARLTVITADPENFVMNDEMTDTFEKCFRYHGMNLSRVSLCDARTAHLVAKMIRRSDIVLLGGGHVPTQRAFLKQIRLRSLLKDFHGVVIGISAGSMNCARVVYAQPEMPGESLDPQYKRFFFGLGLSEVQILPHYQNSRYFILDDQMLFDDITYADSYGNEFLAMPDGSYVLEEDGHATLYGEGYRIADGEKQLLCSESERCVLY